MWFFTLAALVVAPKMANFARTKRNVHIWDSLHYPTKNLLPVPPESVRAHVDVITKFSDIDRFPFSAAIDLRCLEARGKFGKHLRGVRVAL